MLYLADLFFEGSNALPNMLLQTSHDLAVSSSSLNLQTIEVSTAHIMVDLTYCCTALQNYV
jgi:hypothetical protein